MTLERDIWLAAKAMIQQYGNDAGFEAAKRADKHLEGGRLAHCATWERIMTAIEKMQAEVREGNFSGACQSFFSGTQVSRACLPYDSRQTVRPAHTHRRAN